MMITGRVKKILKTTLIIFLVFACVIFSDYCFSGDPFERFMFTVTRTGTADEIPNCSGNITDIRVTVRERSSFCSWQAFWAHLIYGTQIKQIYYGYCIDGQWYDYPAENYELKAFSSLFDDKVAKTAIASHCVRIGPYLLIAFPTPSDTDILGVMQDSLGSEAFHLTEYGTSDPSEGANCFRVVDPVKGKYASDTVNVINNWYYIVVNYDSITEDYEVTMDRYVKYDESMEADEGELHAMTGADGESGLYLHTFSDTYTYEDIQTALAREYDQ